MDGVRAEVVHYFVLDVQIKCGIKGNYGLHGLASFYILEHVEGKNNDDSGLKPSSRHRPNECKTLNLIDIGRSVAQLGSALSWGDRAGKTLVL